MGILRIVVALFAIVTLTACVHERVVARPRPPRCRDAIWVEGHRDRMGRWRASHWRCPGEVVIVH